MIDIPSQVMAKEATKKKGIWQPKIIAFLCSQVSYASADLAGSNQLLYDSHIEIIRVPCSGRIDPIFILKSFKKGADGVLLAVCHPGKCHYLSDNYYAQRKFVIFCKLLEFCGFDQRRIHLSFILDNDGVKWTELVNKVVSQVREAGPSYYNASRRERMGDHD